MCTICDSTDINTIIEFVPLVSGDGFNGGSDSCPQFRDTHGFGAELPLDNCTPTIILNNPVYHGNKAGKTDINTSALLLLFHPCAYIYIFFTQLG